MRSLLDVAHQEGDYPTLYSNIYDLKSKVVYLYNFHNFEEEVEIRLEEALNKGIHTVELATLFQIHIPFVEFIKLRRRYLEEEVASIPLKGWLLVGIAGLGLLLSFGLVYYFVKGFLK